VVEWSEKFLILHLIFTGTVIEKMVENENCVIHEDNILHIVINYLIENLQLSLITGKDHVMHDILLQIRLIQHDVIKHVMLDMICLLVEYVKRLLIIIFLVE
jgi:hypothetical protein